MIVSKTPLRMSFVGGGSDLPAFYREEVGAVLSTSIDKYIYVCVNKKFDGRIRVSYTRTEDVELRQQVEHPLVREALDLLRIDGGIEIVSMADIPSKGSGLGSSSTYTVGLLNALYAYRNQFASKGILADQACDIEINRCGEPIGKQDQYAAAFGGLNLIRFHPDDSVSVDPVICKPEILQMMEDSMIVFFTGRTRSASAVLANQSVALQTSDRKSLMRRMVQLAFEMKEQLESGSLDYFGDLLDENWRLKAQLTEGISDPQIDSWYSRGLANGALGGKLLGAGNGGFILFYAPKERHPKIISALAELQQVKFRFDRAGAQIVFYQPIM
ncbi:GHMP family kinase ATP-binding protein [Chromobacterium paludis]|uniref:GHMP kinase n=1 Tax=Chromobacterium paludis TaxID=2605945 RepID=A0A5C1DME4_9NEIS|nr:GHMP kinase [Chromobacterium paludis]QEL57713.1 GHMP kinase [Chromobacterium paludis]